MSDDRATTVVIARSVRAGRERDAATWVGRLVRTVGSASGFLGATTHEPDEVHPGEWVIVYSFASVDQLDDWLTSPARASLMAEAATLFVDDGREQRLADRPTGETITLVSSVTVRPDCEPAHQDLHAEGVRAAAALGGLVRAELLPAVTDVQPGTVALLTFVDRAALDRWLVSEERAKVLERMQPLLEGGRTINVVGGFGGWFSASAAEPRRWRQAVVVFAGLVPVALLATMLREWLAPDLPLVAAVAIGSAINVVVLTWIVMPMLTRLARGWLSR